MRPARCRKGIPKISELSMRDLRIPDFLDIPEEAIFERRAKMEEGGGVMHSCRLSDVREIVIDLIVELDGAAENDPDMAIGDEPKRKPQAWSHLRRDVTVVGLQITNVLEKEEVSAPQPGQFEGVAGGVDRPREKKGEGANPARHAGKQAERERARGDSNTQPADS